MNLPLFEPHRDPGPSFVRLLKLQDAVPEAPFAHLPQDSPTVPYGTTVVAVRHSAGVLLAGDRRATSGNFISHRNLEKVFPAGRHSGIAVAGAAGPSIEMVRLFQLQLEHYEKVEGQPLSLEGQANQLGQMVRSNLTAALTGLVAVPLFAGYDLARESGRLFQYDITGGRYEEQDFATNGSGRLHASTVVKLGYKPDMPLLDTIDLVVSALFEAAEEDAATGGPDLIRRIFPVVATVDELGYRRIGTDEVEERVRAYLSRQEEAATHSSTTDEKS